MLFSRLENSVRFAAQCRTIFPLDSNVVRWWTFSFSTHLLVLVFNFIGIFLHTAYRVHGYMRIFTYDKMRKRERITQRGGERKRTRKMNAYCHCELLFSLNIYLKFTHTHTHIRAHTRTEKFRPLCFNCTLLKVIKSVRAPQETHHQCHFVKVIRISLLLLLVGPRSCFCFNATWLKSLNWDVYKLSKICTI